MQDRSDKGQLMQDRTVAGQDGCRTGQMQYSTDAGKDRCRTRRMKDKTDAVQYICRTGQIQYKTEACQDRCSTGRMQDRTDTVQCTGHNGCSTGRLFSHCSMYSTYVLFENNEHCTNYMYHFMRPRGD